MFKDRKDAGKQLARKLAVYAGKSTVVLALPRGGVVTGYEISRALKAPFDIIAVRKVGHPSNPEYAVGAVDENGASLFNKEEAATIDAKLLRQETAKELTEARRRSVVYRGGRASLDLVGKIVLLVDDGIATGLTMRLAVRSVKAQEPEKVIVAAPVAPLEAIQYLKKEGADDVITLEPPEAFNGAVGAHYEQFEQVEDAEVVRLLR
ncbi:MAG: phosphoribosyltransferase family protein [Candidatus Paceibacterota bacterium]|jgi:predicted phosphoribosyltransferase